MKVQSLADTLIILGETFPFPTLVVIGDDGEPLDPSGYTATLEFTDAMGETTPATGVADGDHWNFDWPAGITDTAGALRTLLRLDGDPQIAPLFGPSYLVYDPAELWVNPADVQGDHTQSEAVVAVLYAQTLVRAWVSVPVQSPVPPAIQQATLLLASRALAQPPGTGSASGSPMIVSEQIADYTVRYANPLQSEGGLALILGPEILALLAPYRGSAYSVGIAPANPHHPLPITESLYAWWWGDAVIYDEEYAP